MLLPLEVKYSQSYTGCYSHEAQTEDKGVNPSMVENDGVLYFPAEYEAFVLLVRQQVVLQLLWRMVIYDQERLKAETEQTIKAARVFHAYLQAVEPKIIENVKQVKRDLRQLGGQILQEKQEKHVRVVEARFRGFIYTQHFHNVFLKTLCEQELLAYLGDVDGSLLMKQMFV